MPDVNSPTFNKNPFGYNQLFLVYVTDYIVSFPSIKCLFIHWLKKTSLGQIFCYLRRLILYRKSDTG